MSFEQDGLGVMLHLPWGDVRAFSSLTTDSCMFNCCLLLLSRRSDWEGFPGGLVRVEFALISQNHRFYSAKCVKQHKCCFMCPGVKAFSEQGDAVGSALLLPGGCWPWSAELVALNIWDK